MNKKKNHDNWFKNKKVTQSKNVKKMLSLKIHKDYGTFKKPKTLPK